MFNGHLNAIEFQNLLEQFLVPFIANQYPNYHCLQMDNAPCHTARSTRDFIEKNNINHIKTPAQSPDLNPIELVWHDMKVFLTNEIKPNHQNELIAGIRLFWNEIVTVEYCNYKINHLFLVLRTVLINDGDATGM